MRSFAEIEVDSTNAAAAAKLATVPPPFYLTARSQSDGRGRAANSWISPIGNLYLSVALEDAADSPLWATFAASVAAVEFARSAVPRLECYCKWPNDIVVAAGNSARKLGGILAVKDKRAVIIGIGINLRSAPVEGSCCLGEFGGAVSPKTAAKSLAVAIAAKRHRFAGGGIEPLLDEWRRHAFRLGEEIVLQSGGKTLQGVFGDVNSHGALLLKTKGGTTAIYAADSSWDKCYWR